MQLHLHFVSVKIVAEIYGVILNEFEMALTIVDVTIVH